MNTQLSPYSQGQHYLISSSGNATSTTPAKAPEGIPLDQVLRAQVTRDSSGEIGLRINDTFVKVELPQGVKEGETLEVMLKESKGNILLQILTPLTQSQTSTTTGNTANVKDAFQNILKALLPELSLDSIKKSYQSKASLVHLLQHLQHQSGASSSPSTQALQQLFEGLYESKSLIPQQALKDPNKLVKILEHLVKAQSGEAHGPKTLDNKSSEYIRQITQTLQHAIREATTPSSPDTSVRDFSPLTTKLATLFAELSQSIEIPLSHMQLSLPQEHSLIGKLFESFLNLKKFTDLKGNTFSPEIQKQLEQLLTLFPDLESAMQSGSEQEIRKVLMALLQKLEKNPLESTPKKEKSGRSDTNTQPLNKFVENVLQTQEQLARLQPLMQTLGDPLFFLMPVILNGMFQNWEMRFDPPKSIDDSEDTGKKGQKKDFTRVHLAVELPSLGGVQIDLAHRKEELLLSLKFEQEDVTDFVDSALPKLERTLRSFGYKHLSLVTRTGTPESVKPEWFNELLDNSTVA